MCNNRHSPLKTRTAFLALLVTTAAAPAADGCSLPESVAPLLNWHECVKHSVKVLADQPEPANSVATGLAVCVQYELAFAQAAGGGSCGADYADGSEESHHGASDCTNYDFAGGARAQGATAQCTKFSRRPQSNVRGTGAPRSKRTGVTTDALGVGHSVAAWEDI